MSRRWADLELLFPLEIGDLPTARYCIGIDGRPSIVLGDWI